MQQGTQPDYPGYKRANHHRASIHAAVIKHRSYNHREHQDEEHPQLKRFSQLPYGFEKRSNNAQCRNRENHHHLADGARYPNREPYSDKEEKHAQQQCLHHAPEVALAHHAVVSLHFGSAFAIHANALADADTIVIRQYNPIHLIAAREHKHNIRSGDQHLKRKHDSHHRFIHTEG